MFPMDYKDTLNLPRTAFPMKANLPKLEPELLERWEAMDIYGRIRQAAAKRRRGMSIPGLRAATDPASSA